jgi:hypothetical protein
MWGVITFRRINMKSQAYRLIAAIPVFLLIVFVSPSVNAAHYLFSQTGFTGGGVIYGSFDGLDSVYEPDYLGLDGVISACLGRSCGDPHNVWGEEVTSFSMHFSGNSFFRGLNNLPDTFLKEMGYDIKNNILGLSFGTESTLGDFSKGFLSYSSYNGGEILLLKGTDGFSATTTEQIHVNQVTPLPGSLIFFATGIASLFGLVRRKLTH